MRRVDSSVLDGCDQVLDDELHGPSRIVSDPFFRGHLVGLRESIMVTTATGPGQNLGGSLVTQRHLFCFQEPTMAALVGPHQNLVCGILKSAMPARVKSHAASRSR